MNHIKKILILNGQYLPGYKGGGPIQSCANMIENLSDRFGFYVLCADRDYRDENVYENIRVNEWNQVGSAHVYYMSPEIQSLDGFAKVLNDTDYDILYLNGFFSPIYTIKPLLLRRLGRLKNKNADVILTPRGDFTGGCENKKLKKYSYIYFAKAIGLYNGLLWHATSEIEERDIRRKFPKAEIFTVPNLPTKFYPHKSDLQKDKGRLRLIFLSRIFPKKNLKFALEVLKNVKEGEIIFDIYGPMEDEKYWEECEAVIKQMPPNVKAVYRGEAKHSEVGHIFEQYHAFFFPTLGENYGHVIVEAMMHNCLCILSRGVTPWDDYIELLNLGASLDDNEKFLTDILRLANCDQASFIKILEKNNRYIESKTSVSDLTEGYLQMFS